eukprot:3458079-Pyramimonas_sp.AAC.1
MTKSSTRYELLREFCSAAEELLAGTTTVWLRLLNPLALSELSGSFHACLHVCRHAWKPAGSPPGPVAGPPEALQGNVDCRGGALGGTTTV